MWSGHDRQYAAAEAGESCSGRADLSAPAGGTKRAPRAQARLLSQYCC